MADHSLSTGLRVVALAAVLSGCGARSALQETDQSAATPVVVDISAALDATCGLRSDGTVVCWGAPFDKPALVPLPRAVEISVGAKLACARTAEGHVACLGLQLVEPQRQFGPEGPGKAAVLPGIADAKQISVGSTHACVLRAGGVLSCWGDNTFGQLGNGTFESTETPVPVSLGPVLAVSAGDSATCALTKDGVHCWGRADPGQLGDGSAPHELCAAASVMCSPLPVLVQGLSNPQRISVARGGACALNGDSRVRCWGLPSAVESYGMSPIAIEIPGVLDATAVYAGDGRGFAIRPGGGLRSWGDNQSGALGDGVLKPHKVPVDVVSLDGVIRVTGGDSHACALRENGDVLCWGSDNCGGQLGLGDTCLLTGIRPTPGLVPLP